MLQSGGIAVADASVSQLVTDVPAQYVPFNSNLGQANEGDLSINPAGLVDKIQCKPGIFQVDFRASGDSADDVGTVIFFPRKNGKRLGDLGTAYNIDVLEDSFVVGFSGIIELQHSDIELGSTLIDIDLSVHSTGGNPRLITNFAQLIVTRLR